MHPMAPGALNSEEVSCFRPELDWAVKLSLTVGLCAGRLGSTSGWGDGELQMCAYLSYAHALLARPRIDHVVFAKQVDALRQQLRFWNRQ
jgi:hypothetical protein